jgi:hypothetical protein
MEEIKTKKCTKCGRELPLDNFSKCAANKDGLQRMCKECHSESTRKSYYKRKEKSFGVTPLGKVYTNVELAKFQPRDLLAELKARGYEWEKMYAPRQEVLYSKV